MRKVYFDHNATTPVRSEVLETMLPYFSRQFGNPSTSYRLGQDAQVALDQARHRVAQVVKAPTSSIYFTSGGTEADNWAWRGVIDRHLSPDKHVITSQIEHHAVLHYANFMEKSGLARVTYVPVDSHGMVDPQDIEKAITPQTIMISVMAANNETGVIQPIEEIRRIAHNYGLIFHSDGVQALGKIALNLVKMGIELMSFSSHKIYGPKGIGALYIRPGTTIDPLIIGGQQQQGLRGGTENIPAIVGFGKACQLLNDSENIRVSKLRDYLEDRLQARYDCIRINGQGTVRLANTSSLTISGIDARALILQMDLRGISISNGSACASGSPEPSHVLKAMGLSNSQIDNTIRISLGQANTQDDIDYFLESLAELMTQIKMDADD